MFVVCVIASQHTLNPLRLQQYTPTVYVSSKLHTIASQGTLTIHISVHYYSIRELQNCPALTVTRCANHALCAGRRSTRTQSYLCLGLCVWLQRLRGRERRRSQGPDAAADPGGSLPRTTSARPQLHPAACVSALADHCACDIRTSDKWNNLTAVDILTTRGYDAAAAALLSLVRQCS